MAEKEVKLMKGNEVIAHAAIRYGCDGYFGYPITPQSEVMETLMELKPWETTGMVVLQAESEISSINMVYGGASTGKRVMTSSSSPGISLMSEGLSYLAGAELPCLVINCQRGGPGLGTIQPSQGDYFQEENEVRYEEIGCDDADYVIVAFGSSARICSATVEMARAEGLKVGLLRPITLYPFPKKPLAELAARGVKGFLSAELNAGQMVEDVRLAVNGVAPVEHFGRQGGMMFAPDEVLAALKEKLIKK